MPSVMVDYFRSEFAISSEALGILAGSYYIGYAVFQIPVGILMDKFHPRYVISLSILTCVAGLLLNIYTSSIYALFFSRFLIGLGSIGGILGAVKAIDDFFPNHYSIFLGMTIFLGVTGAFFGTGPLSRQIQKIGPENTILNLIFISLFLAMLILFFYKRTYSESQFSKKITVKEIINFIFSNKILWKTGILGGMMIGPMGGFADMWASLYLVQVKGMDLEFSRLSSSMIFMGLGVGSVFIGFATKRVKYLTKLICFMGICQFLVMSSLFFTHMNSPGMIITLCFTIGFLCSYQVCVFALAKKVIGHHLVGVSTSLVNSLIMIFGFVFNFCVGEILEIFFGNDIHANLEYDEFAYQSAFSIILISTLAASMCFVLLSKFEKNIAKNV